MNEAPRDLPSLEEWEGMLAVWNADQLEKCMDWVHSTLRYVSDSTEAGGAISEEWSYWTSLFVMAKREYKRRENEY